MSEIRLLFSIMASSLANVSDSELVEEFRRRFIVYQWYKKEHIEELCNDGEEIDEEMYEAFKDWLENKCTYHLEIDEATQEMLENFRPEDTALAHQPYYCDGGCGKKVGEAHDDDCKRICDDCEEKEEEEEDKNK